MDAIAMATVTRGLQRVNEELASEGMPVIATRGRLIRPLLGLTVQEARGWAADAAFWRAIAAVQYAHEASLLHDDILDDAAERRGERTLVAERGVKAALVRGDHLLTSAYRLAASTGSLEFAQVFARSVERTVAGEVRQARAKGEGLTETEYREIVAGKSGELLGCAFSSGAAVRGDPSARRLFELGRRLGICYQMLDDLIDYCPDSGSGKPPLQDYRNRHWTWPLGESGIDGFDLPVEEVAARFHAVSGPVHGLSPARRCLARFERELHSLARDLDRDAGGATGLLEEWRRLARTAVARAEHRVCAPVITAVAAPPEAGRPRDPALLRAGQPVSGGLAPALELPDERAWRDSLHRHARSFSFAALWFPRTERRRVADVYAFCRFTDDLVDRAAGAGPEELGQRLDVWLALCRRSWGGETSRWPSLDRVLRDAARSGVPFRCVEELVSGMRMDLRQSRYRTLSELRIYTHRVAGVVGVWLTHLFGVRAPWVLERASLLGHAMQLTNILRDVGEDLERGRIYIPQDLMAEHGVRESDLWAMRRGANPTPDYVRLLDHLMAHADDAYAASLEAVRELPPFFRRPVVVAARVYQGIHDEIRRNGYDNLRIRARTSGARKIRLALRALTERQPAGAARGPERVRSPQDVPGTEAAASRISA